jgi:5'-nucleotidase
VYDMNMTKTNSQNKFVAFSTRQKSMGFRRISALLAFVLTSMFLCSAGLTIGGVNPLTHADVQHVDLITFNDFHGRIDSNAYLWGATIAKQKALNPTGSLLVSAGDNIGASLFASFIANDTPSLQMLKDLNVDVSTVGNHEFDKGWADLRDRVLPFMSGSMDYLGANVYLKGTKTQVLPPSKIITTGNGVKVAIIGAVTESTPTSVIPSGITDLDFGDPVEAVNTEAKKIHDAGSADIIVADYHEGSDVNTSYADAIKKSAVFKHVAEDTSPYVAGIINGHTHLPYAWTSSVNIDGTDVKRPIVEAECYAQMIGYLDFTYDKDAHKITAAGTSDVDTMTLQDGQTKQDILNTYPSIQTMSDNVDQALANADAQGSKPIATTDGDITRAFTGGSYVDGKYVLPQSSDDAFRGAESSIGRLTANFMLDSTKNYSGGPATFAIVNPGGLRADIMKNAIDGDGTVNLGEAASVLPYANEIMTVQLTGSQIKTILEQQWQPDAEKVSRKYLALGLSDNVSYTVDTKDTNAPLSYDHVKSVSINGIQIDPNHKYTVSTNAFLAAGGDNFTAFTGGTNLLDTGVSDTEGFIDYLEQKGQISPDFTKSRVVTPGNVPTKLDAGANTSFKVDDVNVHSSGAPENVDVYTYLEPVANIDKAEGLPVSDKSKLVGHSSVADQDGAFDVGVSIPKDSASGNYVLKTIFEPSGTTAYFPLAVTAVEPNPAPAPDPIIPVPTPVLPDVTPANSVASDASLASTGVQGMQYISIFLFILAALAISVTSVAYSTKAKKFENEKN